MMIQVNMVKNIYIFQTVTAIFC